MCLDTSRCLCDDLQLEFAAVANWLAVLRCAAATFVQPVYIIYALCLACCLVTDGACPQLQGTCMALWEGLTQ